LQYKGKGGGGYLIRSRRGEPLSRGGEKLQTAKESREKEEMRRVGKGRKRKGCAGQSTKEKGKRNAIGKTKDHSRNKERVKGDRREV